METAMESRSWNSPLKGSTFDRLAICDSKNSLANVIFGVLGHYEMKNDTPKNEKEWKRIEGNIVS
jgi:hypothetical protein